MRSITRQTFIALSISIALPVFAATSAITHISFTTQPQTVAPHGVSDVISIQLQNAAGEEEKLDETGHLTFISSSATGEFLGSTGKPVTTTMSKGTANRSFYYRDTTEGTHTIRVTVSTGSPEKSWEATQVITVGSPTSPTTESQSPSNAPLDDSSEDRTPSAHGSPSDLSSGARVFLAGAGRSRSALVHTPVRFEATRESPYGVYRWSFGDGGAGFGNRVVHSYQEPGTYVVVLNADFNGKQEISRTLVTVSLPRIHLQRGSSEGTFIFRNTSDDELNVGGWTIDSGKKIFTFPDDTILLPGQRITIAVVTGSDPLSVVDVRYPDGSLFAHYDSVQLAQVVQGAQALLARTTPPSTVAVFPSNLEAPSAAALSAPSTSPRTLVLPLRRSWWQLFIDTVFAR